MSVMSRFVEFGLKLLVRPGYEPRLDLSFMRKMDRLTPPKGPSAAGCRFIETSVAGVTTWIIEPPDGDGRKGPQEKPQGLIYLHGGAYLSGPNLFQWRMICRICADSGIKTYLPLYRLAPEHPFPAALDDAFLVYRGLSAENRLSLIGDSAGGGLALSTLYRIRDNPPPSGGHVPPADRAVLLSPWLDLNLKNPDIPAHQTHDHVLEHSGLREAGVVYAGSHDPSDPLLSPIHGDPHGLPPLMLLNGTHDILYPDNRDWAHRVYTAKDANARIIYIEEPGMFHVWPALVPFIPEARRAIGGIVDFLHSPEWLN